MAKLNTKSAATSIGDTDILWKDDSGSTTSEKVTGAILKSEVLSARTDGEGTTVNGSAIDLDVNTLSTESTIEADDFIPFYDTTAGSHKKVSAENIPGANGAIQLAWKFSTTTSSSDPGSAKFRYDNSTPASITEIYVDDITDEGGFDASTILGAIKDGDVLYIQESKDAANAILFRVNGVPTDEIGWWTIPVTVEELGSGGLHSDNKECGWLLLAGVSPRTVYKKDSVTLAAAATTFSVSTSFVELTGDGGSNTVSTITGGVEGQTLVILCTDGNVTITDTDAHTADTVDLSAAFTSADDTTLTLIYDGTSWYELSRSVN